ncbi:MAG: hypothetical protein IJ068_05395 [Bacilli bacterium]|nr:hypothetical protein [Bacilli bacterium]
MILTYQKALRKYKTTFYFQKALKNGEIKRIDRGLYFKNNDDKYNELEYVVKKFPNLIFTMDSAFYYLGILKEKPKFYHLASNRTSIRIKDTRFKKIIQYYQLDNIFKIGKTTLKVDRIKINIYDRERLLIELIRNRNKVDKKIYDEVITYYINNKNIINEKKLTRYIKKFKVNKTIIKTINNSLNVTISV